MTAPALLTKSQLDEALGHHDWGSTVVAPTKDVRFVSEDDHLLVRTGDAEYPITTSGLEQALGKVPSLSKSAIKEWPIDMFLDTVNWFYEHGDGDTRALVKDDSVVGFTRDASLPMHSINEVIERMETTLSESGVDLDGVMFNNVRVRQDLVSLGMVAPQRTFEPKVGDVVQGGIWLQHSPTSLKPGEISAYVNRLVCSNGMISGRSLVKWSWRGGDNFSEWVRMSTMGAWGAVQAEFEGLRELTTQPLNGHASTVIEDLFERHHVPAGLRSQVLEAVVDEADGTMYGIAQAFNRAANLVVDDRQMRGLLMVSGGVVAQDERCGSCFRSL